MKSAKQNNIKVIMSEISNDANPFNGIDVSPDSLGKRLQAIPLLGLKDIVLFPGITVPVPVEGEHNRTLVKEYEGKPAPVFITCVVSTDAERNEAEIDGFTRVGVIGNVLKVMEFGDEDMHAIVTARAVGRLTSITSGVDAPYKRGNVTRLPEVFPAIDQEEVASIALATAMSLYHELMSGVESEAAAEMLKALDKLTNPVMQLNFAIVNSPLDTDDKQQLLEVLSIFDRLNLFITMLGRMKQYMEIRNEITQRTQERLTSAQREHFLRQQISSIEEELGGSYEDEELNELDARAEKMQWSEQARAHYEREMRRLERFPSNSPEYGIQYTYLENLLSLPWDKYNTDDIDLKKVRDTLDADHFGLDKVKERIVEQMAVLKLRNDMKAPILCLYGPPGVGKTSLGKSVAAAMGREYARVALGGVHDESEIRGHRRTYVGAMPGRIIAALKKVGSGNPVFVLDEIDKIASDAKGDPSTALLEVLDPEQNSKFHDNYLNFDYDLSRVLFFATANDLSTISRPLLDRMELIEIPGYITEEKVEIAKRHLLPKVLSDHGLKPGQVKINGDALVYMIDHYTHESGVRQLEKALAKLVRKIAVKIVEEQPLSPGQISIEKVRELMGPETEDPESYDDNSRAGVVTGLAWTAAGGEILFIEVSLSHGKGRLTLTGRLGDVMKESAQIALEYIRSHCEQLGLKPELFDAYDVHVHVPEGAVPKDGPSAGITILTALASAFTRRRVAPAIAMTGELTLLGKVLPVGGIKEKILAAKRAGIKRIILCEKNRKDIEQIAPEYLKSLDFIYVTAAEQVLDLALTHDIDSSLPERKVPEKAKNAVDVK